MTKQIDEAVLLHQQGKLPPQASELEEAILGCVMLEKESMVVAVSILKPDMFYSEQNKAIFEAICKLFNSNKPIDLLTVIDKLRSSNKLEFVGGALTITELTNKITSSINIEFYCRVVYEMFIKREMIKISNAISEKCYDTVSDAFEVVDEGIKNLLLISSVDTGANIEPISRMQKAMTQIEFAMKNNNIITGIPSGYIDIDNITGGWQNEDLITIGGRPASGKSALALNLGTNAAKKGFPTYMFSAEMSDTQLAIRELGAETGIKYSKIRKGQLDDSEIKKVITSVDELSNIPLYVNSSSSLNITYIRSNIMKAIHEKGIKMVIIDYLSYIDPDKKSGYISTADAITLIIKELKRMAKQFKIPIIVLAQLNREVEKEADKRPKMHHLKSSGGIEEGSDMILFVYRPSYYDPNAVDMDGVSEINNLYVDIAKHKQGATGGVKLYCEIEKNIVKDDSYRRFNTPKTNSNNNDPF